MSSTEFKIYGSIFKQSREQVKERLGENYRPDANYAEYTGNITVPVEAVPDLIDYLSEAPPVTDNKGRNSIKLSIQGWVNKTEKGTAYQGLTIKPDYKTVQAMKGNDSTTQAELDDAIPF